jgi:methionine-rich copper-binding protein CopC
MAKHMRWLIVLAMVMLVGGVGASVAYAHAELRTASPPIGAQYRWTRPSEIRLAFSQDVKTEGSSITLVNRQFQPQPTGAIQQDPNDASVIFVTVEGLNPGTYTVNWVTDSVDGHTIQGSYDFTLFPRESVITAVVAPIVLVAMGIFVWTRRAKPTAQG